MHFKTYWDLDLMMFFAWNKLPTDTKSMTSFYNFTGRLLAFYSLIENYYLQFRRRRGVS